MIAMFQNNIWILHEWNNEIVWTPIEDKCSFMNGVMNESDLNICVVCVYWVWRYDINFVLLFNDEMMIKHKNNYIHFI